MREVGNFSYIVKASSPENIIQIWDAEQTLAELLPALDPKRHYTVSCYLESMRLDVFLPSFNKAGFPEIFPEMTAAETAVKLMEVESKFPKTGLAFYRKTNKDNNWIYLSEIVLQNRGRRVQIPVVVPHFTTNELKILSRDTKLGIQKIDYGNGSVGEGSLIVNRHLDQVQIEGDFRFDIDQLEFTGNRRISRQSWREIDTGGVTILSLSERRAYFEIQNNSQNTISILFGEGNQSYESGIKLAPGELYHPASEHIFTGRIWGRTKQGVAICSFWEMEYF